MTPNTESTPGKAAGAVPRIEPYLFFEGRCEEAIGFYREALGAEVTMLLRFRDHPAPDGGCEPPAGDKIMHASLRIGATSLMVSDGRCVDRSAFRGFTLSLAVATVEEARRCFAALQDGGAVVMPMGPTFFSPQFGMLTDRFGVGWMVIVPE